MVSFPNKNLLKEFLEEKYKLYASRSFVDDDPIQIPHRFQDEKDIEVAGLLTATIAWGNRKSIILSMDRLLNRMDNAPYEFVVNYSKNDAKYLKGFVHRTFNQEDCTEFIKVLKGIYTVDNGLKSLFQNGFKNGNSVKSAIGAYRSAFTARNVDKNVLVHVPDVESGSAAKRINMFLRWMVRSSKEGIDFGLWTGIPASTLMIPVDTHSGRVARSIGLLSRKQNSWLAVEELTSSLREFDDDDPVKYDFALFGLGVYEKF